MRDRQAGAAMLLETVVVAAAGGVSVGLGPSPARTAASTPAPAVTPAGGISLVRAIRIAVAAVNPTPHERLNTAAATTCKSSASPGRWCWVVRFGNDAGPASELRWEVVVDFQTGRVIASGREVA
jgi:hypothetical protein